MPDIKEVKEFYNERQKDLTLSRRKLYIGNKIGEFIKNTDKVIDVGCGDGLITIMASFYGRVVGCDLDTTNVAKRAKGYPFFDIDITKEMIPPNSADVILFNDVIEHLPERKVPAILHNLIKATKDKIIINIPIGVNDDQIIENDVPIPDIINFMYTYEMDLVYLEKHNKDYIFMVWEKKNEG